MKIESIALYLVMSMVATTTAASCSVVVNEMELNPPQMIIILPTFSARKLALLYPIWRWYPQ